MDIKQSREHIEHFYAVKIDEASFKVIDEERCLWIAMATTEGQEQVALLTAGAGVFMIFMEDRHKYAAWFNKHL